MKLSIYKSSLLVVLVFLVGLKTWAQENQEPSKLEVDHNYKPMVLPLSEDGKKFIRFITWHQFWVRHTEHNPGTVDVNGEADQHSFDVGLRRSRFLVLAQVSPRFLILTHFGINNHTFVNGGSNGSGNKKPGLFMHDAWTEYAIVPEKLHIGTGLHYWNGISRMSNASTLNFMTLDAPIFNWPTIELTDQFARQFGIYAKGMIGRLDYRVALNKPFVYGSTPVEGRAVNVKNDNVAVQGYANYQFFDKESNKLPFYVGTYLGTKKIFNVGFGWHYHPEATGSLKNGQTEKHDMALFGADVFYEKPVGRGSAVSFYSAFYHYDFGPNYIRNVGIMNIGQVPAEGDPAMENLTFNGVGNAQPTIGTGAISYSQFGFLLPRLQNGAQLMPYLTYTHKNFERLKQASSQVDVGLNYFINGHHAKITLQYSTRPIYDKALNLNKHASDLIIQTHIFL